MPSICIPRKLAALRSIFSARLQCEAAQAAHKTQHTTHMLPISGAKCTGLTASMNMQERRLQGSMISGWIHSFEQKRSRVQLIVGVGLSRGGKFSALQSAGVMQ